jgi:pyruvate formate lyase activating enzyme
LAPGERGKCGVRENIDGKLYALNYGKAIAINIDPIEKKPFYHFLPGSHSLSIATVGCNFSCLNCQNWEISQAFKGAKKIPGEYIPPERIVETAIENKVPSISYTYTEPTIFLEYALDTMKLAKKAGLKNNFVSNGFMSEESAKLVIPYLDANNIDIKGFSEEFYQKVCGGRLKPVLDTAKLMKKSGVWVEITTLVIPTLSDSEEMFEKIAKWIYDNLGPETPWHISQFCGAISWKLQHIPDTPVETLEKAIEIGKRVGLKYVYIGNVPGHKAENTYCPKCGTLAINRVNYFIHRYDKNGKCPKCGEDLNLILK